MKTLLFARRIFLLIPLAAMAPSLASADVVLHKAPPLTVAEAPAYPENLARFHFGARVSIVPQRNPHAQLQLSSRNQDVNASESALLCDDPATGYRLAAGDSTILVSLATIENIESIAFLNDGAAGEVAVATSNADVPASSPEWHEVGKVTMGQGAVNVKVGPEEAKYVRLTFHTRNPGRIAAFGVFATPSLSDFTMPRPRKVSFEDDSATFALVSYSFTDLHLKARALYATSGNVGELNKMIDGQPETSYQFSPNDGSPTAVIDLGRQCSVNRISAIYAEQPGNIDFYVVDRLPGSPNESAANQSAYQKIANDSSAAADLPASLTISDKEFASMQPAGSVTNLHEGHGAIDFPARNGRYIILRWHPAMSQTAGFSVAQVAAFGPGRGNAVVSNGDGKEFADGKNIFDNKNIPAAGEEIPREGPPPALPPVPPFTFIPEVPPASP